MRARYTSTNNAYNTFGRILCMVVAFTVLGPAAQVASGLEFTTWDVTDHGDETWTIIGHVNVNEEVGEIADIDFGGAISGGSTSTYVDGTFLYEFLAPFGSLITFTASTLTEQSNTEVYELFDPNAEP